MRDIVNAPIFIRLGARMRGPEGIPAGACRRIILSNIVVYNADPRHGSIIGGIPGHDIEDLQLSNVHIYYKGGGTAEQAARVVPEFEQDYPEPYRFGVMPASGFFIRHVNNLKMENIEVNFLQADQRSVFMLDDVKDASFYRIKAPKPVDASTFDIRNSRNVNVQLSQGIKDTQINNTAKKLL